ncbi:MAG: YlxR family protein [Clostridia bacterium]|nr:YlxR family protein [Clostridia bacterium]
MKNKKNPMRRCIGCMESKNKNDLIRIAWYEGKLTVDPTGKAKGRGVYLCKSSECMEKARKKNAITRSLQVEVSKDEMDRIFQELKSYEE